MLAYVFGSRADGRAHAGSDCDIGLVTEGGTRLSYPRQFEVQADLEHRLRARVDVVGLRGAPIELQYAAVIAHCRVYERNIADRVDYEAYVYDRYVEELPRLRWQREQLIRGEHHEAGIRRHRESLEATRRKLAAARGTPPPEA